MGTCWAWILNSSPRCSFIRTPFTAGGRSHPQADHSPCIGVCSFYASPQGSAWRLRICCGSLRLRLERLQMAAGRSAAHPWGGGPARHLHAHHHDLGQVLGQGACAASGAWVPVSRPRSPLAFFLLIRNLVYVQSRKLGKFYNRQQQIEQEKFS